MADFNARGHEPRRLNVPTTGRLFYILTPGPGLAVEICRPVL